MLSPASPRSSSKFREDGDYVSPLKEPCVPFGQKYPTLVEHFNASQGGLESRAVSDELQFGTLGNSSTLHTSSSNSSTSRNRKDVCENWAIK